ncbi:MAG: sulfotransferase [Phormidesmis sp. RL_2_1]|nr:sulfotransferase [Phormidesmis sp. RL_2_1]
MTPQKPTFLIIGSAKCGTTALASILSNHPDCCMSRPKEVKFFLDTIDYKPNNPDYEKGWDWYQQAFAHYNGEAIIGEGTPNYSARTRSPNTAKRVYGFNPNMKLIYMVRNPLERQVSAWKMEYTFGQSEAFPPIPEYEWALKGLNYWMQMQREQGQWNDCCYGYQLEAYEAFFPRESICVSFLEDWKHSKDAEISRILRFLDLDPTLLPEGIQESANRGADRKISRPLVKKLEQMLLFALLFNICPQAGETGHEKISPIKQSFIQRVKCHRL